MKKSTPLPSGKLKYDTPCDFSHALTWNWKSSRGQAAAHKNRGTISASLSQNAGIVITPCGVCIAHNAWSFALLPLCERYDEGCEDGRVGTWACHAPSFFTHWR